MEHRVYDAQGSLAQSDGKGKRLSPDAVKKMQKKSLHKLARDMSHGFDPAAVHEAMGKVSAGGNLVWCGQRFAILDKNRGVSQHGVTIARPGCPSWFANVGESRTSLMTAGYRHSQLPCQARRVRCQTDNESSLHTFENARVGNLASDVKFHGMRTDIRNLHHPECNFSATSTEPTDPDAASVDVTTFFWVRRGPLVLAKGCTSPTPPPGLVTKCRTRCARR